MINNLDFPNGTLMPQSCAVSAPSASPLKSPTVKATAAPSLAAVLRSSRVRAWVPQHLIDSLYAKDVK
jgi:hypothetical protein